MAKKTAKAAEVKPAADQNTDNVEPQAGGPSPAALANPSVRSEASSDSTASAAASGEDPNKTQSITEEYSEDSERANGIKPEESANTTPGGIENDEPSVGQKQPQDSKADSTPTDETTDNAEAPAPEPESDNTKAQYNAPAQQASEGRIVLYVPEEGSPEANNYATVVPAVICRVWENEMVNLRVFADGPDVTWKGSVNFSEEKLPRTWHWPPRK